MGGKPVALGGLKTIGAADEDDDAGRNSRSTTLNSGEATTGPGESEFGC